VIGLDLLLWQLLGEDFDLVIPLPPRVPVFARETVRPGRKP
jgi:hypothetical protein